MSAESVAASAGLLAGILSGWRRDANPGALDDMVQSPNTYGENWASTVLLFGDGEAFTLICAHVDASALKEALAHE